MKIRKTLKFSLFLLALYIFIILCNTSVFAADTEAPTECKLSINDNSMYIKSRFITLDIYGTDASDMQVWISNDGETGTALDFDYGKTINITDSNYTVGVPFTSSNSTITTNSDNVLRIVNWPLSSVNGPKRIYAVFRDIYGNKTSVNGLSTVDVTFDLNGSSGICPTSIQTVKGLGVYLPEPKMNSINTVFIGWDTDPYAEIPNYSAGSIAPISENTVYYCIYKAVDIGDYVYYPIDTTRNVLVSKAMSGASDVTFYMKDKISSSPALFRVLESSGESVILCPNSLDQTFQLTVRGKAAYTNQMAKNAIRAVCTMYATDYSSSTDSVTYMQMAECVAINELNTLFANYFWDVVSSWGQTGSGGYGKICNSTSYNERLTLRTYGDKSNDESDDSDHSATSYVAPAITLKPNVKLNGLGTKASPYTLSFQ